MRRPLIVDAAAARLAGLDPRRRIPQAHRTADPASGNERLAGSARPARAAGVDTSLAGQLVFEEAESAGGCVQADRSEGSARGGHR